MFRFIVLLSSLPREADITKCLFLNDETCMVRPTLTDMNSECDGIIIVMDIVSTKKTNTIATNVTSTASILLYFAYSFISDHININNYYYLLSLCKTKRYNIKWKIMNFKKFLLKIVRVIISMT